MDIEFHHYMTRLIAVREGFRPNDPLSIAYASRHAYDWKDDDEENRQT